MVKSSDLRLYLRGLYLTANKQEVSLGSKINSEVLTAASVIGVTGSIIGTSGNGRSTSYGIPDPYKHMTQDDKRTMVETIAEVYEDALITLSVSPADDDASENSTIFNSMMADDRLAKVTSVRPDFTLLGWPFGGVTVP